MRAGQRLCSPDHAGTTACCARAPDCLFSTQPASATPADPCRQHQRLRFQHSGPACETSASCQFVPGQFRGLDSARWIGWGNSSASMTIATTALNCHTSHTRSNRAALAESYTQVGVTVEFAHWTWPLALEDVYRTPLQSAGNEPMTNHWYMPVRYRTDPLRPGRVPKGFVRHVAEHWTDSGVAR